MLRSGSHGMAPVTNLIAAQALPRDRLKAFAVASENFSETVDVIPDPGAAQTTPHLRLIARNDGFAGDPFDLLGDFERANPAAAQENCIRIGAVEVERKTSPELRCYRPELDTRLKVEPLDIENLEALFVQKAGFLGINFIEIRGPHDELPGTELAKRIHHPGDERHWDSPGRARSDFGHDARLADHDRAGRAAVADYVRPRIRLDAQRGLCHVFDMPGQGFVGGVVVRLQPRDVDADVPRRHVEEISLGG